MPDARCTCGPVCKKEQENAHEHTGSAEAIRHSLRNGFTAYAVLTPATNSVLVTVADGLRLVEPGRADFASASLTSATDARPHGFAVRSSPSPPRGFTRLWRRSSARRFIAHGKPALQLRSRRRCRVHRSPPHVRDDGQRPSDGTGCRSSRTDLGESRRGIFSFERVDQHLGVICPSGCD